MLQKGGVLQVACLLGSTDPQPCREGVSQRGTPKGKALFPGLMQQLKAQPKLLIHQRFLTGVAFPSRGHLAMSGEIVDYHTWEVGVPLSSSRYGPAMSLNSPQCTG